MVPPLPEEGQGDGPWPSNFEDYAASGRGASPLRRLFRLLRVPLLFVVIAILLVRCDMPERLFFHPLREPTPAPRWLHPSAEAFWIDSTDGVRLRAWFIPGTDPDDPTDRPVDRPTVLHLHGNAGNMNHHVGFTGHLVAAGLNLVLVDYRGFGESDGTVRVRADVIADARAALRAVAARDDVDASRLGVYGQSLGGAVAISAIAAEHDGAHSLPGVLTAGAVDPIGAIVLESPFSSWRTVAANAAGGDPPLLPARWLVTMLIDDTNSPLDAAPRVTAPTLVIHGDADRIVPVSHGRALAAALPNAQLVVLPGGEHNSLLATHPEVAALVAEFFLRHLAPAAPRSSVGGEFR